MSESPQAFGVEHHAAVPLFRDVRVIRWVAQIVVLIIVVSLLVIMGRNLASNLDELGLDLSFEFLSRPAGFAISEGPAFDIKETMGRAYVVSVINTLRVVVTGIALATILGTIIGIARLSTNWLVNRVATIYIEIFQNTPLLVQLFFWFELIRRLPRQRIGEVATFPPQTINLGIIDFDLGIQPLIFLSQRKAALPGIERQDAWGNWWPFLIVAIIAAAIAWRVRVARKEREGIPPTGQLWWALAALFGVLAASWIVVSVSGSGSPLHIVVPKLIGDPIANYEGGWLLTNNFQAILIGLTLYTAAFIAEAVRSGIQAVSHGQVEAATAIGLTRGQRLRLVVLPQATRVIIPPLTNQYLSLTKNSSLAIAVGFPDLFNTSQTIGNQTGQNIQVIGMVLATYLATSLITSIIMNFVNKRMQFVER